MTPSSILRTCFRRSVRLFDRGFLVTRDDKIGVSPRTLVLVSVLVLQPAAIASAQQLAACCQPESTCTDVIPSQCAQLSALADRPTYSIGGSCNTTQACCQSDGGVPSCSDLNPCDCLAAGGISTSGTCAEQCCAVGSGPFLQFPSPFGNLQDLCYAFHGFPTPPHVIPPPNPISRICVGGSNPGMVCLSDANCLGGTCAPFSVPRDNEAYIVNLARFLRDRQYVSLGWLHDLNWRLTGPLGGDPGTTDFVNEGTHLPCKIYYSPGIVGGLCNSSCSDTGTVCATGADCPSNVCNAGTCSIVPTCVATRCLPGGQACTSDADCPNSCTTDADCPEDSCLRHGRCINTNGVPGAECRRQSECPDGSLCVTFPPGSMLIKEMHPPTSYVVDPTDQKLWLKDECYNDLPSAWTVMIRGNDARGMGSDGSHDGWFWLYLKGERYGNPPILGSSAVTADDFFDDLQALIDHDSANMEPLHFPTGEATFHPDGTLKKEGSIVPPLYQFGRTGCLNCHASAVSDSTYADLSNILGRGTRYSQVPPAPPLCPSSGTHDALGGSDAGNNEYPRPLTELDPLFQTFVDLFPQYGLSGVAPAEAFGTLQTPGLRFPAATYDHIVTSPVVPVAGQMMSGSQNREMFLTSDQCSGCHDATALLSLNQELPNMVLCEAVGNADPPEMKQINLSPFAEWSASPMGMAGRDPIFFSQLEGETTKFFNSKDCIENLCLHCHGVMGQRQLALDNPTTEPGQEICRDLLNPELWPLEVPSFETTEKFTRDYMNAWPGKDPNSFDALVAAKYGGLGRDGVSCKVCHSISNTGLADPGAPPSVFSGNFNVDPEAAHEVNGPYPDDTIANAPMGRALGIRPQLGDGQITDSALCGSCHAINLPVLDSTAGVALKCTTSTVTAEPDKTMDEVQACEGKSENDPCNTDGTCKLYFGYEQTTYLEWVNSDFTGSEGFSCIDCHMPKTFHDNNLTFKIANIEDNTFPNNPRRLPDSEITLTPRDDYGRHLLYGLNVFFNEIAQQFPLILGLRQIDDQNSAARPALFTAREAVLKQARETTALVEIVGTPTISNDVLTAEVKITNITGHKFPSGVGFRRAFIEFQVLEDTPGGPVPIWASGRTNELGVIVEGTTNVPLVTEFFDEVLGCPDAANGQCYQAHHQTITDEDQVQIYEELQQNNDPGTGPQFTTSFLERFFEIKDNRLLPAGWCCNGQFAMDTKPGPGAIQDPEYGFMPGQPPTCDESCGKVGGVTGADTVKYEIQLTQQQAQSPLTVRATLYSQSIPPYYLKQRFDFQPQPPTQENQKPDIARLHYITSRLNTAVIDDSKEEFIKDWKLRIDKAATAPVLPAPTGACCNVAEGVCTITTENECQVPGLRYGGDGSDCDTIDPPCEPPEFTGACCDDATGICTEDETQAVCEGTSRRYGGDGSTCSTIDPPCEPPPVCGDNVVNQPFEECDGTDDVACPEQCQFNCTCPAGPVTGQCCFSDGSCEITTQSDCASEGGDFSAGRSCGGDSDGNGTDDACEGVPAASAWGMMILVLALLIGIASKFGFRRRPTCG